MDTTERTGTICGAAPNLVPTRPGPEAQPVSRPRSMLSPVAWNR